MELRNLQSSGHLGVLHPRTEHKITFPERKTCLWLNWKNFNLYNLAGYRIFFFLHGPARQHDFLNDESNLLDYVLIVSLEFLGKIYKEEIL